MKSKTHAPIISDYDASNYDYETYWKGRSYEDHADKIALKRFLENEKVHIKGSDVYIDIGGSYGREVEVYNKYFKHVILFDYSINSLKKGKEYLDKKGITNVSYVAGNLYFLPFKDSSIEAGQMVRVMHHVKSAGIALSEIDRVISKFFILEFANKVHGKFVLRSLLKLRFADISNISPMQQTFRSTSQGSKGEDQIFLNFHPTFINEKIQQTNLHIKKKLSVSNYRLGAFKKIFSKSMLINLEKGTQSLLAPIHFGPSMYYLLVKDVMENKKKEFNLEEILCCPKCKGDVRHDANKFICDTCMLEFPHEDGVYNMRYVEEVI